ncbi:MAG: GTPase ObgE [Gemmatimonadota bacterium]|nr:GTPase ObgE [Gemmatimonadota bacterium]
MFVDRAEIQLKAGDGGKGLIAFRREKHNSRGGPCGGKGGRGGSVYFEADQGMATLMDFRYRILYKAPRGAHGGGNNRAGRKGEAVVVKVPAGTLIKDMETGELIADLTRHGERVLAVKGGSGGRGNESFASAMRRNPDYAEDGRPGEEKTVGLELKLIADVGLVGFPNSGKSTLLSRLSDAHPKVADYPFTTLTPNLGVVEVDGVYSFVVADIPGLIEGAHDGKGLGLDFLRHIERTRILLFLIDVSEQDPGRQYEILCSELEGYSQELVRKARCVVFSKMDLLAKGTRPPFVDNKGLFMVSGVSAVTGQGMRELKHALAARVRQARASGQGEKESDLPPGLTPQDNPGQKGVK